MLKALPLGQNETIHLDLSLTPMEVLGVLAVTFGWPEALDEYALKVKGSKGKILRQIQIQTETKKNINYQMKQIRCM